MYTLSAPYTYHILIRQYEHYWDLVWFTFPRITDTQWKAIITL